MAMVNIPKVLQGQTFAVAASYRASDSVIVKARLSDDSQYNFGYGACVPSAGNYN